MSYGFAFGTETVGEEEVPVDFGDKWSVIVLDDFMPPTLPGPAVAVVTFPGSDTRRFYGTTPPPVYILLPVEFPAANLDSILAALESTEPQTLSVAGHTWTAAWTQDSLDLDYVTPDTIRTTIRFVA